MKQKIGIVTLEYDREGNFVTGNFQPEIKIELPSEVMAKINSDTILDQLQKNADLVLADWFSHTTNIELNQDIKSEVLQCVRWPNGKIAKCQISYHYIKS